MSHLVPIVLEDSGRGERSMDIYSRLLKDRIVFIGCEIDDHIANLIIAQMLFLQMDDPKKDINVYINTPGGIITAGMAIYDTMKFMGCDIKTYCIGQAASMGSLLLAAGTKGKRYALPNSRIMMHQPAGGVTGSAEDIALQAKEIAYLKNSLNHILADLTGKPLKTILEDTDRDFFMSADEAVAYGLVDEVVQPKEKTKDTKKKKWAKKKS